VALANCVLFSTERGASLAPLSLDPAPATLVDLEFAHVHGEYSPGDGAGKRRGGKKQTLDGVVVQDFGVVVADSEIALSISMAISSARIAVMDAAWAVQDGLWYWTDSISCWKVRFASPDGWKRWKNLLFAAQGDDVYSFELKLWIVSKDL